MYKLPDTLQEDISQFARLAAGYQAGTVDADTFKAFRVPMGIYEQRASEVYMARIRATGGVLAPAQLKQIIAIARKHHSNLLHLTTRQEIQIQNLALPEIEGVLRDLQAIGLATKGGGGNTVRNMLVAEESGLTQQEVFDPTPYAFQLTSKLIAEPDSYGMPRKLKMAFSNGEQSIDYAAINDLGFVAKIQNGQRGFVVYVGGGTGAKPTLGWKLYDFVPETQLYAVAEGVKHFFNDHGNRENRAQARLRYLFYKWGVEETLLKIRTYVEQALATEPPFELEQPAALPNVEYTADGAPSSDAYQRWEKRYVTQQDRPGYATVFFPILSGNIWLESEEQVEYWNQLLDFIIPFGDQTFRFTTSQSIRFRNLPLGSLPDLYRHLQRVNPAVDLPVLLNNLVTCTGADTCRQGICYSKGLANAIREALLRSDLDLDRLQSLHVHISGCPNSCGQPLWGDIGFVGKALRTDHSYPAYQVLLGAARTTEPRLAEPVGNLNAHLVPDFVVALLSDYLHRGEGEFAHYLQAVGKEWAQAWIAQHAQIPLFETDPHYYYDWGSTEVFRVKRKA